MSIIIASIIIILGAFGFNTIAQKIKISTVVSLIFFGLLFSIPSLKDFILTTDSVDGYLSRAGDIALIGLMLLAGLETSQKELLHERKEALSISLIAAFTPFLAGTLIFKLMGFSLMTALMVGVTMSITAEATTAALLLELKKSKTKLGTLMMEAGIIDDILGFVLFIMITFFLQQANFQEDILVSGSILAFFIGVLIQKEIKKHRVHLASIKKWIFILLIPFFFVSIGLNVDLLTLFVEPKVIILTLLVAFLGKMLGTMFAKPFTNLNFKQLYLVGWAMNSRGAIGLALALIAYRTQLVPIEIYSSLVITSLVTTILFPFFIIPMIKKEPRILN